MLAKYLKKSAVWASVLVVLAPVVSGCSSEYVYHEVVDYRENHPIVVNKNTVEHTFYLGSNGTLQANDIERIELAANEFIKKGEGLIEIQMPFVAARKDFAKNRAKNIATELHKYGVARNKLYMRLIPRDSDRVWPSGTENKGEHYHPVYVRYDIYDADVPECGDFSPQPMPGRNNQVSKNFGCATQRNIGLMVANPRDLVKMRQVGGRSGVRANNVMNGYVSGGITASQAPVQAGINISN